MTRTSWKKRGMQMRTTDMHVYHSNEMGHYGAAKSLHIKSQDINVWLSHMNVSSRCKCQIGG